MKNVYKLGLVILLAAAALVALIIFGSNFLPREFTDGVDKNRFVRSRLQTINENPGNDIEIQNVTLEKKDGGIYVTLSLVANTDLYLVSGSSDRLEKYLQGDTLYVIDDLVPNPDNFFSVVLGNYQKPGVFLQKGANYKKELFFDEKDEYITHFHDIPQIQINPVSIDVAFAYIDKDTLCGLGYHSKLELCDEASNDIVTFMHDHQPLQKYIMTRVR